MLADIAVRHLEVDGGVTTRTVTEWIQLPAAKAPTCRNTKMGFRATVTLQTALSRLCAPNATTRRTNSDPGVKHDKSW